MQEFLKEFAFAHPWITGYLAYLVLRWTFGLPYLWMEMKVLERNAKKPQEGQEQQQQSVTSAE